MRYLLGFVMAVLLMPQAVWAAALSNTQKIEALNAALSDIDAQAQTHNEAAIERLEAKQAIAVVLQARSRDREAGFIEAQTRVDIADLAIKTEQLRQQSLQLDQERDAMLLEASKRDAALARKDAERLRMQTLAREEQQELIRMAEQQASADQAQLHQEATDEQTQRVVEARAKETELMRLEEELSAQMAATGKDFVHSKKAHGRSVYTMSAVAFTPGQATLSLEAQQVLIQLAKKIKMSEGPWVISAHTDNRGDEASNVLFSKQRAQAVQKVLLRAGVPSTRLLAVGLGSSTPVASNQNQAGRAQNRRVEIRQK